VYGHGVVKGCPKRLEDPSATSWLGTHVKKLNSIRNLAFLINDISNYRRFMNNPDLHIRNLVSIRNKISNPITEFITQAEIDSIDQASIRR
jgi:hypothetical protein